MSRNGYCSRPGRDTPRDTMIANHREKMARKRADRKADTGKDAHFARQLAKGAQIRGNYSNTPKGVKRTRKPILSIWPADKVRPSL